MSDNRRVYSTTQMALKQMYPSEPKGNVARMLNTLAALVSGILLGKSCQLPAIARKAADGAMAASRIKRYSRWIQLDKSHLSDPRRLSILMIAACLAYLWFTYLSL